MSSAVRSKLSRARGGERVASAGTDADQPVIGLHDVARARQHERGLRVGHYHHRFEPAQEFLGPPVLAQLYAGASKIAGVFFDLGFEPLEQREGIGGGAREARDHVPLAQPAHLAGVGLHHGLAEGHLPVARDDDGSALADGKNGGGTPAPVFVLIGHLRCLLYQATALR